MNKSFICNFLSFLLIVIGYLTKEQTLLVIGLFAFSGAITNAIAIHMLFEKVPFLYGSGVVESRFEEFKKGIYSLIMDEFFTKENVNKFFEEEITNKKSNFNLMGILQQTDFTPAFNSLKKVIIESKFGGMLQMFGGEEALEPLRKSFVEKLKGSIIDISRDKPFQDVLHNALADKKVSGDIYEKISNIVKKRLNELTAKMIKQMVQKMIKKHLGWLVVWGAVFGGLIGFVSTIIS